MSAIASAFPEIVAALVHERSERAAEQVTMLRRSLGSRPLIAALKEILSARGLPISPDVRPPLRRLDADERRRALEAAEAVEALA